VASVGRELHRGLLAAFDRAATRHGVVERDLTVAGTTIRLSMTPEVAALNVPAFFPGAVAAPPGRPTARIVAWDSAHSGEPPPTSPWTREDFLPRDGIRGSGVDGVDFAYSVLGQQLSVWDRATSTGVCWAADCDRLPYGPPTEPFVSLLEWALADRALALTHAAAVGTGRGGVLLVGKGGKGKSTTAFACVAAGWSLVSDDYCVLTTQGAPSAHAIFRFAKLDDRSVRLLPAAYVEGEPGFVSHPKRIIALDRVAPDRTAPSLTLRAVIVPRVAAATGAPVPRSGNDGLRALAPSTIYQLSGARPDSLARFATAIRGLPVYELDVGPDVERVAETLGPLLEDPTG
jgi:hypothetical protein